MCGGFVTAHGAARSPTAPSACAGRRARRGASCPTTSAAIATYALARRRLRRARRGSRWRRRPACRCARGLYVVANVFLLVLAATIAYGRRRNGRLQRRRRRVFGRIAPAVRPPAVARRAAGARFATRHASGGSCRAGSSTACCRWRCSPAARLEGALVMLAFGVGTLPNLLAAGWLLGRARAWLDRPRGPLWRGAAARGVRGRRDLARAVRRRWPPGRGRSASCREPAGVARVRRSLAMTRPARPARAAVPGIRGGACENRHDERADRACRSAGVSPPPMTLRRTRPRSTATPTPRSPRRRSRRPTRRRGAAPSACGPRWTATARRWPRSSTARRRSPSPGTWSRQLDLAWREPRRGAGDADRARCSRSRWSPSRASRRRRGDGTLPGVLDDARRAGRDPAPRTARSPATRSFALANVLVGDRRPSTSRALPGAAARGSGCPMRGRPARRCPRARLPPAPLGYRCRRARRCTCASSSGRRSRAPGADLTRGHERSAPGACRSRRRLSRQLAAATGCRCSRCRARRGGCCRRCRPDAPRSARSRRSSSPATRSASCARRSASRRR